MARRSKLKAWIEAMRLHTLPVSLAGIGWAAGIGVMQKSIALFPLFLCLIFAVLAQIASNFANEYFDFRAGLDRPGREGFRRGVSEGDLSAPAMLKATMATLLLACCVGLLLVAMYGAWWMYLVGVAVAIGALAYSAGPFPLSRIGLGEVAVIAFFGLVPVLLTVRLEGAEVDASVWAGALGVGLMGANVLVVNNYRDRDDDAAGGKRTLAVRFGLQAMRWLYLCNGVAGIALSLPLWLRLSSCILILPAIALVAMLFVWRALSSRQGAALNPVLAKTAMLMFLFSLTYLLSTLFLC